MELINREGKMIPSVVFRTRNDDNWEDIKSDNLFEGKKVIVFSLPGAYTPTCSTTHLPRFNELAPVFKKNGIDEIICLSVNDGFVMEQWGKDQEAQNLRLIPDGNGEFSEKLGMLVDKSELVFGKRSWRYSMYVENKQIRKMFIEPQKPGDPFEVSDADTMLEYLFPEIKIPKSVTLFTKPGCGYCEKAKKRLTESGLHYEEIILGRGLTSKSLRNVTGRETVPQVYIEGKHIGESDKLEEYLASLKS